MTVSDSSLRTSIWDLVYTLINDNKGDLGASSTPSVYGKLPDREPSFPAIIIRPISVGKDNYSIGTGRTYDKLIPVVLQIYSKKNQDIDVISDALDVLFEENPITGIFCVGWEEDDGEVIPSSSKIKLKTITITFKRR